MIKRFVSMRNLLFYFLAIVVTWLEAVIRPTLVAMIVSSFEQHNLSKLWWVLMLGIIGNIILLLGLLGKRFYYARLSVDFRRGFKKGVFHQFLYGEELIADEILSDLENDVQQLERNYVEATVIILSSIGFTTVSILYALWTNFYLGLIFILFYAVPALFSSFGARRLDQYSQKKSQANQAFLTRVNQYILGNRIIRNYQAEEIFEARFEDSLEKTLEQDLSYEKQRTWNSLIINGVDTICSLVPLIVGGIMTYYGWVSAASFVAIYLVSYNIGYQFQELSYFLNTRHSTLGLRKKYDSLFQKDYQISPTTSFPIFPIVFDKVSFSYDGRQILKDFSMTINEGEKIAVIGESGSGKTTFLNLLYGDLEPDSGQILFAGRLLSKEVIRQETSYIFQQHIWFSDMTLEENISLRSNYQQPKMEEIIKSTLLDRLSNQQSSLSGGEKQRVEIARSLYHDKRLILADEVKSNLDSQTALMIEEILLKLPQTLVEVMHHYDDETLARYHQVIEITRNRE